MQLPIGQPNQLARDVACCRTDANTHKSGINNSQYMIQFVIQHTGALWLSLDFHYVRQMGESEANRNLVLNKCMFTLLDHWADTLGDKLWIPKVT